MPNDFTDSNLKEVQIKIDEIFMGGGRTRLYAKNPPVAAQALMQEQTSKVVSLMNEQGICVSKEIIYLTPDSVAVPTVETTSGATALACDFEAGETLSSVKKTYDPNMFLLQTIKVDDDMCNNAFEFQEVVAKNLASRMQIIADSINQKLIGDVQAFAQTPTAANFPTGTVNATTVEYAASAFQDSLLLGELKNAAILEDLAGNYFMIDGNNYAVLQNNSLYTRLNDDDRSTFAQLTAGQKIYYDHKKIDAVTGANSTFMVDPNMYAIYFNNYNKSDSLIEVGDKDATKTFRLPLQYMDLEGNSQILQFANGGVLQPVYVDIDYRLECKGVDGSKFSRAYTHKWELKLEGMFDLAPATAGSGIIHIVKV